MTSDKPQEECGVIGIWNTGTGNGFDTAEALYYGLHGIQHRGQQSAGIAVVKNGIMQCHKELGLVTEVISEADVERFSGAEAGLGHVGYQIERGNNRENAQPFLFNYYRGRAAISYNGFITNAKVIRSEYLDNAYMFQTTGDAEIIATMFTKEAARRGSVEEALVQVVKRIVGSYSFLMLTPKKLIAVRDPYGMKPLCIGMLGDSYVFSTESSGLSVIGASFIRDIKPGEIVTVDDDGLRSIICDARERTAMCIFEFVYLARADSYIDGSCVYQARFEAGRTLALESPADADLVVGVPDSGLPAAIGYSRESGLPFVEGLIKNRYIGRTFIQPSQSTRELSVGLKLNALRCQTEGKRIVLVDDSIVRGTTSRRIVQMMKEAGGASEVHVRVSSPPVKYPCYYGIDTPDKATLMANKMTPAEMCKSLGADSLAFLSHTGLMKTPVGAKCSFCSACFDGCYPIKADD